MLQRCIELLPWVGVGIVLGLPFLYAWAWWFVFLGVGWFVWMLYSYEGSVSAHVWRGWVTGTTQALCVLSWGLTTYPLTWLQVDSPLLAAGLIGVYWIVIAAVIGVSGAIVAGGAAVWKRRIWYPVYISLLWLGADLFGAYLYSVVLWGAGGGHDLHFSFGTLGYPLLSVRWFDVVIQQGTVYAGTMLVVLLSAVISVGLYHSRTRPQWVYGSSAAGMLLVVASAGLLISPPAYEAESAREVIAIDTRFSSTLLKRSDGNSVKARRISEAIEAALAHDPDVIILPEDSRYTHYSGGTSTAMRLLREQTTADVVLIDSGRHTDATGRVVMRSYSYVTKTGEVRLHDKRYLTPQGEFLPYLVEGVLHILPPSQWRARIFDHLQYRPGRVVAPPPSGDVPAVLFCMESVSPWVARQVAKNASDSFIAHPVSHAWFSESSVLTLQMRYMLRARALEGGVPIIKAANMTNGYMVTPSGGIDDGTLLEQTEFWSLRVHTL